LIQSAGQSKNKLLNTQNYFEMNKQINELINSQPSNQLINQYIRSKPDEALFRPIGS